MLLDPRDPLVCRVCLEREGPVVSQDPRETEWVTDDFRSCRSVLSSYYYGFLHEWNGTFNRANVMTGGLVVLCVINMQPSSLSNRVTTDRKDLRELLERTVLEWVQDKSLVSYIKSHPNSVLYKFFPPLISPYIFSSLRVWLVPLVLLVQLDPTAPRWEHCYTLGLWKGKMFKLSLNEQGPNSSIINRWRVCVCVLTFMKSICYFGYLTDWFSPVQGETGPTGPNGAPGTRGAPVSTFFCQSNSSSPLFNLCFVPFYGK